MTVRAARVRATLPTLGTVGLDFHRESAEIRDFLGESESRRLQDVTHLGLAAAVFTGLNHSRLEYQYLQCAIIDHLAKLHKDDERLALSASVAIPGRKAKVSSGSELLKCWSLLSNYGHAKYTYGVERSLLQYAKEDGAFLSWLLRPVRHPDLRAWAKAVVEQYRDAEFHYVLSLARIAHGTPFDRRKAAAFHYLRVLLLGTAIAEGPSQAYKLGRLREVFRQVRLLSMVTLDSYYSGHPFRFQLGSALNNLAELFRREKGQKFERTMVATAGWLADELYLHPRAVAVQREYEIRAEEKVRQEVKRARRSARDGSAFLAEVMVYGLGKPQPDKLSPLIRLTFPTPRSRLLGPNDRYQTIKELEGELCDRPATCLSIDRNPFEDVLHVDILYDSQASTVQDVARVYCRLRTWLTRAVEAEALSQLRKMLPSSVGGPFRRRFRQRHVAAMLVRERGLLVEVFYSVLRYLLPPHWTADVSEFVPSADREFAVQSRVLDSEGVLHDAITPRLDELLSNPNSALSSDRLQEVKALRRTAQYSRAPLLIACAEKIIVRDQFGQSQDEWDGAMLELTNEKAVLTIVEAKRIGAGQRNVTAAKEQLIRTREVLTTRHQVRSVRRSITGLGAKIQFNLHKR